MSNGKHRRYFERRSAGDPGIVGKKVYDPESQTLIGIPQLQTRHPEGGWVVIVVIPGEEAPAHLRLYEVLIQAKPQINIEDPPPSTEGLDHRVTSLYPVDSEYRQKLRERGAHEGALDQTREEGVSGEEEALPPEGAPDPPPDLLRPSGPLLDEEGRPTDVTIHPRGREFGRTSNPKDDVPPSGEARTARGGSTMASVAEVKAAIDGGGQKVNEATGTARAAIEALGEAQQMFLTALEGSGHDSVATAHAGVEHAKDLMEQAIQAALGAVESASGYAANL